MYDAGPLHCKYVIEENTDLHTKVIEMVKWDNIVQWLGGDDLKQDQFKFLYSTMRTTYMSAIKETLLADDKKLIEEIIPRLAAYRAMKQGRDILSKKKNDQKREQEKLERQGIKAGGAINVSAFQPGAAQTLAEPQAPTKITAKTTSKSPVRGASPSKVISEKQQSLLMQQQANDFAA